MPLKHVFKFPYGLATVGIDVSCMTAKDLNLSFSLENWEIAPTRFFTPELDSRLQTHPASTINSCTVHIAPSSDAKNSTICAMSSGISLSGKHWLRFSDFSPSSSSHKAT